MKKSVGEIAKIIEGELCGDASFLITGFAGLKEAQEGDLAFVANSKYIPLAQETKASAIIIPRELSVPGKTFIRVKNPSLASPCNTARITEASRPSKTRKSPRHGISDTCPTAIQCRDRKRLSSAW